MFYLRCLCLLAYRGVQHILCCVSCFFIFVLCFVFPMLPVSMDCSFLIASSVFSNVYFQLVEAKSPPFFVHHLSHNMTYNPFCTNNAKAATINWELLTFLEHLNSPQDFIGVLAAQPLVFYVILCWLFFVSSLKFVFGYCILFFESSICTYLRCVCQVSK